MSAVTKRRGSHHALWISEKHVLTIEVDKHSTEFPPQKEHLPALNRMIQGLARAQKAVLFQAENDRGDDTSFQMQPIQELAEAIILLSQLSEAVQQELCPVEDQS